MESQRILIPILSESAYLTNQVIAAMGSCLKGLYFDAEAVVIPTDIVEL